MTETAEESPPTTSSVPEAEKTREKKTSGSGLPCPCGGKLKLMPNAGGRPKSIEGRPYMRRRRQCDGCKHSFTTYEFVVEDGEVLVVSRVGGRKGRGGHPLTIQGAQAWLRSVADSVSITQSLIGRWIKELG